MNSPHLQYDVVSGREDITQKADVARWEMRLAVTVAIAVIVGWLLWVVYCRFAQRRWPGDLGAVVVLVLCASLCSGARARLLALQHEDVKSPNQAAEPIRTAVTPPAGAGDRANGAPGSS